MDTTRPHRRGFQIPRQLADHLRTHFMRSSHGETSWFLVARKCSWTCLWFMIGTVSGFPPPSPPPSPSTSWRPIQQPILKTLATSLKLSSQIRYPGPRGFLSPRREYQARERSEKIFSPLLYFLSLIVASLVALLLETLWLPGYRYDEKNKH